MGQWAALALMLGSLLVLFASSRGVLGDMMQNRTRSLLYVALWLAVAVVLMLVYRLTH